MVIRINRSGHFDAKQALPKRIERCTLAGKAVQAVQESLGVILLTEEPHHQISDIAAMEWFIVSVLDI